MSEQLILSFLCRCSSNHQGLSSTAVAVAMASIQQLTLLIDDWEMDGKLANAQVGFSVGRSVAFLAVMVARVAITSLTNN